MFVLLFKICRRCSMSKMENAFEWKGAYCTLFGCVFRSFFYIFFISLAIFSMRRLWMYTDRKRSTPKGHKCKLPRRMHNYKSKTYAMATYASCHLSCEQPPPAYLHLYTERCGDACQMRQIHCAHISHTHIHWLMNQVYFIFIFYFSFILVACFFSVLSLYFGFIYAVLSCWCCCLQFFFLQFSTRITMLLCVRHTVNRSILYTYILG